MDFHTDFEPDLTPAPLEHYAVGLSGGGTLVMRVCPLCRVVLGDSESSCPRDGQSPVETTSDELPSDVAERFEITQPFACGDSGTLWLAVDRQTGRRGVLELLRFKSGTNVAERQRLKRELVKQATLS